MTALTWGRWEFHKSTKTGKDSVDVRGGGGPWEFRDSAVVREGGTDPRNRKVKFTQPSEY